MSIEEEQPSSMHTDVAGNVCCIGLFSCVGYGHICVHVHAGLGLRLKFGFKFEFSVLCGDNAAIFVGRS